MKAISYYVLLWAMLFSPFQVAYFQQTPVPIEFRNYEVVNGFPKALTFKVEICNLPENSPVYLYYKIAQSSWTFSNDKVYSDGLTEDDCQRRRISIETTDEPPMLSIQYYWLVRSKAHGGQIRSPQNDYLYEDSRFKWHVLQDKNVAVHWHDRPEEFGKKVFDVATLSIVQQRDTYGIDLKYPAQIVIENTTEEFMSWQLNPDPDIGGLALPWYGMTIQIVDEDSNNWLNEVLPHEISHLYLYQVALSSEDLPPLWLDEGLAVYNEFSDHLYEDRIVRIAVQEDRIIPLLMLRDGFGAEGDRVDLAYAESYYVVIYIIEVHGKEKLAQLLDAYNNGKEQDEAFALVFNQTIDEFETDWGQWVKAKMGEEIPVAITPTPQEQSSSSSPARTGLVIFAVLCCFSLLGLAAIVTILFAFKSATQKKV